MAHHSRDEAEIVLVVDDDEFIREMEVRILNQLGYNVLQAEDPAHAMRLAAATPNIHLLLTDFLMPGADGLELAAQFRTVHPHTPVLMVSGSLPLITARADQPDHFALLGKPFTRDDLVRKVRNSLKDAPCHRASASSISMIP
jgi:DNA-binding NtrC family response regulator